MSTGSIRTVANREIRETLSDWRIIVPISLLTFVLPFLVANGTVVIVQFVDDARLADGLVPFALLVVGFIPSSFSIITALESFVGERERNTLEALLAMPVSDRELYTSKLLSSLLTPLASSYLSMTMFTLLVSTFYHNLFASALSFERLLLLFVIIGLMASAMVAGAVVISSHISSIRAANLMSSFILLPAALIIQASAIVIISGNWDTLWFISIMLVLVLVLLARVGMASFNREDILSREHRRFPLRAEPARRSRPLASIGKHDGSIQGAEVAVQPVTGLRAAWKIAERELRETTTDWRMLLPVGLLTFVIPIVLLVVTPYAINFLQDEEQLALLVPFAILVIGFIPASFSLITALDSFVGERERNSLESLLAMPISNKTLYIAKLCSSLVVPILTSYTAMLLFTGGIALFYPSLYAAHTSTGLVLQLLLMIGIMILVMVCGAVIISSHTASIRAANLLASFILIPITVIIAVQFPLIIAERWDIVWIFIAGMGLGSLALMRTGLRIFNREEILSRENQRLNVQRIIDHFNLCFREYRPAGVPFDGYRGLPFSARRFYRHELPALLLELRWALLIGVIAIVAGLAIGNHLFVNSPGIVDTEALRTEVIGSTRSPGVDLTLTVFANNLRVSILSNVLSLFSFGIFAFLVPATAAAQIGFITSLLQEHGGTWAALGADSPLQFVLAYVVPHGLIELPAFLLSAALGIRLGVSLLAPPGEFSVGDNMLWALANFAKAWVLVLVPLIALGSLVEGTITPQIIQALYGT